MTFSYNRLVGWVRGGNFLAMMIGRMNHWLIRSFCQITCKGFDFLLLCRSLFSLILSLRGGSCSYFWCPLSLVIILCIFGSFLYDITHLRSIDKIVTKTALVVCSRQRIGIDNGLRQFCFISRVRRHTCLALESQWICEHA